MTSPFSRAAGIKGADDFLKLSKALKAAGQTGMRRELNRAMVTAAKPLIPKVRESARERGPKKNKLNERLAGKPYRAQTRTGARTAGVRIVGTKVDPRINAQGRIAHPVFGRPGSTVVQFDPKLRGYFDDPLRESIPQVRRDVVAVLEQFADRIVKDAK